MESDKTLMGGRELRFVGPDGGFDPAAYRRHAMKQNGYLWFKTYERTKPGKLMRTYRNMKSRVDGTQKSKSHLYLGLPILAKEEFYQWSLENPEFNSLFDAWVASGYERKLSPSIDRIETSDGYVLPNIQWLTFSENSRRGTLRRNELYGMPSRWH